MIPRVFSFFCNSCFSRTVAACSDSRFSICFWILIIAAGSIYGKSESGHKEGEPDVVGTFSVNRDENLTVVANRKNIEDREAFARELLQMYKDDSFYSTKFSTDRGYATSLDMNIYLWKEDIEDGESVMTAEYRPVEYGKDYDVAVSYTHLTLPTNSLV